jgi:Mn2+/Fe2+ NRAMP family transporter
MPVPAPRDWRGVFGQLGPGLILSAMVVGSGELIVTPKLGAAAGFTMLWFIVLGCVIKVFVQVELGRHAVTTGATTLAALDRVPGPRLRVSWLLWLWLVMYVALVFQVAGIVGGLAGVLSLAGLGLPVPWLAVLIGASCALLLVRGRYRTIEGVSAAFVAAFTFATLGAAALLQATPFAVSFGDLREGLSFRLPESFNTAFAAFGVIGVGASELIYYPYWCLEKGYGASVGPPEPSSAWAERARGWLRVMKLDAWLSCLVYTTATVAFYVLGAAVLHAKRLVVEDRLMIETLSHMYGETFGAWSLWLFLAGAFAVLYSTAFGATASNARLFADALAVFRLARYADPEQRERMVRVGCVLLPLGYTALFLLVGAPVSLVFVGAFAQGLMLPFLALATLHLRFREVDPRLRPGAAWTALLGLSVLAMVAAGAYQVVDQLRRVF